MYDLVVLLVDILPILYIFFNILNRECKKLSNIPNNKKNMYFLLPLLHIVTFCLYPNQVIFKDGFKEVMFLVFEILLTKIQIPKKTKTYEKAIIIEPKEQIHILDFKSEPINMRMINKGNVFMTEVSLNICEIESFCNSVLELSNVIMSSYNEEYLMLSNNEQYLTDGQMPE